MDSHIWRLAYQTIREVDRSLPRSGRRKQYSDVLIVAMYLWSVWHDRPMCWACDRSNYGTLFRPRKLPSVSQFCRRIQSARCEAILQATHERLARSDVQTDVEFIDGRPLPVGACSKDPQARPGRVYGGFARGYKLHAIITSDGRASVWSVMPLNVSEKTVAEELIHRVAPKDLLLGDGNYDSQRLYDCVASYGGCLLTPHRKGAGQGHHRQSVHRLAAIAAWQGIAGYVYRERSAIERVFGQQSSFGGGLGPLPAWVRGFPRVRRWVGAKLIIYHARLAIRRAAA